MATRTPMPMKMRLTRPASEFELRAAAKPATATASSAKKLISPCLLIFRSMRCLAQFPFFKHHDCRRQHCPHIGNDISERLADITPLERALARIQSVGEPEKLTIRRARVKHRGPPRSVLGPPAKKVIRHDADHKKRRANGQRGNHN